MNSLIGFTIFAFLAFQAHCLSNDFNEVIQVNNRCAKQLNITEKLSGEMLNPADLPNDPIYKEFLVCIYQKHGFLTEDGNIIPEKLKSFLEAFLSKTSVDKIVNACENDAQGKGPGEKAFNILQCLLPKIAAIDSKEDENEVGDTV